MKKIHTMRLLSMLLATVFALLVGFTGPGVWAEEFKIAKIYFEYNASANDLGVHVSLDAEDWELLQITHPNGTMLMEVMPKSGFKKFGLTEMFFEGAEPSLEDVPLRDLLAQFPQGIYKFQGKTVNGTALESLPTLSHAIPAGPRVSAVVDEDEVTIKWSGVSSPPPGFPRVPVNVVGYQVISGLFQVTLPATSRSLAIPEEYVRSLPNGTHPFEVLAIEKSGNQTLTEGTFVKSGVRSESRRPRAERGR
ncbi:MAG: hypothetical protein ACKVVP_09105 [Chloroflexota bacterium]